MYENMQAAQGGQGAGPDMSGFTGAQNAGAQNAGAGQPEDDIIDGDDDIIFERVDISRNI